MSTALSLVKRLSVLFLMPCAFYLLPTILYVLIVLSIGKIMHLLSKGYYFQHKYFLHDWNKEKIPRRGIAGLQTKTGRKMQRYGKFVRGGR